MYAILLTALLALFAIDDRQAGQPGQPGQPRPGGDKPGMAASFDGNWTVVAAEMNGQPVAEAKNMTVRVRDNVVTFGGGAGGADKGKMKAMRVSFGPNATVRVTEAGADGKFGDTGTGKGGTGTTPPAGGAGTEKGGGTQPGGTTGAQPGGTTGGASSGTKSGVYVLTQDYLAICIHDDAGGTGTGTGGTRPGGTDPGTRPGTTPPAGGTGTQPGGTGTQPGGTAGTQPGGTGAAGADTTRPNTRTYLTVVLKRDEGGARPGDTPKPDR